MWVAWYFIVTSSPFRMRLVYIIENFKIRFCRAQEFCVQIHIVALKSPQPDAWTIWLRASSRAIIFPSPPTLKNFSLCIRSMWRPMCIFCLALYTQYGHWNCGSLPHSHFWWFRNDDFSLYIRPQSGHVNPSCMPAPFPAVSDVRPLPLALPDEPFGDRSSGRAPFVSIVLTHKSRGKTNGWAPSRSVVTSGMARRSFHCSHVSPAIFVMLKSSAAVTNFVCSEGSTT